MVYIIRVIYDERERERGDREKERDGVLLILSKRKKYIQWDKL